MPTVVPGTEASAREVKALGEAIARGGRAVYEAAEEGILDPEIREMWKTMSRDTVRCFQLDLSRFLSPNLESLIIARVCPSPST